ncbi:MAG: nitronate monooxygenase [Planctomycetota bacterium]|nr:nitronate monooxygenase [Planctomycetota bacterium]
MTRDVPELSNEQALPTLIQGGMGVAVSNWRLARAVASEGQLGVVSGVAIGTVLARRLQDGDAGGEMRAGLARFPDPEIARKILERYFRPEGRAGRPYLATPVPAVRPSLEFQRLAAAGAFVEVTLAREGHSGPVGINFLEKLQLSNLPAMYGALLAGVDFVLVGAGIPRDVPAALDQLALHRGARLRVALEVDEAGGEPPETVFDPAACFPALAALPLMRPRFLAIVSSVALAEYLLKHATGRIDGFVIEGPTAGGHNAPPRGALRLSERGEPIYGPRDAVDFSAFSRLGLPFWLAGGWGSPERLREARALGATGVQVGTAFAVCDESGLAPHLRRALVEHWGRSVAAEPVFTDPLASPTHFPFKVVPLAGTLADPAVYAARERICDLGFLRATCRRADGSVLYRCPAEPVDDFVAKGGAPLDTQGRKCLCNALVADIGLAQVRSDGYVEPPIVTAGDGLRDLPHLLASRPSLHAADLVHALVGT